MVTICLQCGDEGFTNALVYCIKCLDVPVHRYCLDVIPQPLNEFVPFVCDYCEVESTGREAGSEVIRIENHEDEDRPLLQSADDKLDVREDSKLEDNCHPSTVKLKVNNDSNLRVVVEKEQACQIRSSQQIREPGGVDEVVADGFPLREDSQLEDDCHPSTVKLKVNNDSNLRVVVENEQACQIRSSQQIHEPEGVGEVVADGSPLREDSKLSGDFHSSRVHLQADNNSNLRVVGDKELACQIGSSQQIREPEGVDEVVADSSPPREDSKLAGDCHPFTVKLNADNDSGSQVVGEKEQACQIGSSQQIREPQGVEMVANISPLREDAKLTVDCLLSKVQSKAGHDSNLRVVGEKEQACQISSSQQICEPQGVKVVSVGSPLRKGPVVLVKSSSFPNGNGKSSMKSKSTNSLKQKHGFKKKHEKKIICFNCGKEGHVKWNCKEHGASSSIPKSGKRKFDSITSKSHTNEVIECPELSSNSPMPSNLKKKEYSGSGVPLARRRFGNLASEKTHKGRKFLHGADHGREADLRKSDTLVHYRSDVKEEISQLPLGAPPIFPPVSCFEQAGPVPETIWRGSFNILNNNDDPLEGFVAHLSIRACEKAFDEARVLPSLLHLKMLPNAEVWPKSFQKLQPNDNIALYIFPVDRRYERTYDNLVEDMRQRKLAMKAVLGNAELLIFTSTELPEPFWRFQLKYYLWGVFRQQKASPSQVVNEPMVPNLVQHGTISSTRFVNHVNPTGLRVELNVPKVCNAETPLGCLQQHGGKFVSRKF